MNPQRMTPGDILNTLRNLRVLVIGDLMLDHYIWGDVHCISPEAPVPIIHTTRDTHTAGGAANVALNLASLGIQASLLGTLGQDTNGDTLVRLLENAGIDFSHCLRHDHTATIVKTRVIARTQQLCRIDREDPRASYCIDALPAIPSLLDHLIKNADAVILSDYAKGVITQPLLDAVSTLSAKHEKLLAVDPKPARRLQFTGANLITPNRHEALELAGLPEPDCGEIYPLTAVCRLIHQKFAPGLLVITLGADGMAICRDGEIVKTLPTLAREVFDVSGAGDTVIATLTAALAVGADAESAAHFANRAAGIVVSKMGTATPTPAELLGY